MAITKQHNEILQRLDRIEAKLDEKTSKPTAVKVTKKQLMEIKGVGEATADEILKLLKG